MSPRAVGYQSIRIGGEAVDEIDAFSRPTGNSRRSVNDTVEAR